jgi:hypothetical protein
VRFVTPLILLLILGSFLAKELQGGGRLAALADWRVALCAGYAAGLALLFLILGHRSLPRLAARIRPEAS